jgi:hypothetical protein
LPGRALKRGGGFDLNATSLQLLDDDISYVIRTKQIDPAYIQEVSADFDHTLFPRSGSSCSTDSGSRRSSKDSGGGGDSARSGVSDANESTSIPSVPVLPTQWRIERIVWLALFEASRASIKYSSAVVFSS